MGRKSIDITGQKFHRLIALQVIDSERGAGKAIKYECLCDCGNHHIASVSNLRLGEVKSCGCLNKEQAIKRHLSHGQSKTKLYGVWNCMKGRCSNPNSTVYRHYGGRGIQVCSDWRSFENFAAWAISAGYKEGLTIDRVNNDGDYTPENCRWVGIETQARNRRNTKYIMFKGEARCLAEWAEILGIKMQVLSERLASGWSVDRALTEPIKRSRGVMRSVKRKTTYRKR